MLKYERADWDLWDDGTFEEWIAAGQLIEGASPVFVLEQLKDGTVKYVYLTPRTWEKREVCFVYGTTSDRLYDSRTESVLAFARRDVAYYEENLGRAKQVLAYVEEKLAAGEEP